MSKRPFGLISIFSVLEYNISGSLMSMEETKEFVGKAHLDISEFEYARFKYSVFFPIFKQRVIAFEGRGDAEKALMKHLGDTLDKYDLHFVEHRYFANEHTYGNIEIELLNSYLQGEKERTGGIAELVDLRRIPLHNGYNQNMKLSELKNHPFTYWPVPLHMLYAHQVPETTMIEFIHGIILSGFNIRQALRI